MPSTLRPFDSWDLLKVVAILLMFVDHAGAYVFTSPEHSYWLRAIGRGAAPIFLFLTGYAKSYRFSWELFWLALGLTVFDWVYFWHINSLNILVTILVIRAVFQWFETRGRIIKRPLEWYIGAMVFFPSLALMQYGTFGLIIAMCGYMRRHESHYSRRLRYGLCALMACSYASFVVFFSEPPMDPVVSFIVIFAVMAWCMAFKLRTLPLWRPASVALKLLSYYSGYIYVFHVIALMLIMGISA